MHSAFQRIAQRRALITRPEPEASQWAAALQAQGVAAQAFPLICIGPAPDPARLQQARQQLSGYRALMFVSGNAARCFLDENTALALTQQAQAASKTIALPRLWSPGPGTARALQTLGVPAHCIDQPALDAAQFDSESLWQQVGSSVRPGDRVLIVRGSDAHKPAQAGGTGREWLSTQLLKAGGQVDYVAVYTRTAPAFTPGELARAQCAVQAGAPWVLSSAQALGFLVAALPGQDWRPARAVTTHPRIAAAARAAGFGSVIESRPALADIAGALASIESWQ